MVGSFLCQAFALHLGDLSQVQPILTVELLLLVLFLATWFRFRIGWHEWLGVCGGGRRAGRIPGVRRSPAVAGRPRARSSGS